eukprot:Gregarina_sp_Poly_1__7002@NODE_380_length_9076_cov_204_162726_g313_i0_p6_GENE_NODE_380_length_9076_cov_204_162726_g313_i0NODE_380_length_9076_cov_204_162726_g313_i0_p6_ORF_typecomplete_len229_score17_40DUF4404/PF14357_6/1_8e04DUF4404/PF14357_6/1_8e04DUF4404/PF14357_6/0_044DUF724/PF05266_14/0_2_NODE_380_length_9076_cov_204_162726_g313_i07471433
MSGVCPQILSRHALGLRSREFLGLSASSLRSLNYSPQNSLFQRHVRRFSVTHWIQDPPWLSATTPRRISDTEVASFKSRVSSLTNAILATNWGDTFSLTLNVPFWEAEYESLHKQVRASPSLLTDQEVARCWVSLATLLDLAFICEDLRDHLNELMEYLDRTSSRESGTLEKIANLDDHIKLALDRHTVIESKCPQYKSKVDESVGRGIELLRKRLKFSWKGLHPAYY